MGFENRDMSSKVQFKRTAAAAAEGDKREEQPRQNRGGKRR